MATTKTTTTKKTTSRSSTAKTTAVKKPAPIKVAAPVEEESVEVKTGTIANARVAAYNGNVKMSPRQALKASPKTTYTIPIDPTVDDDSQYMELGYCGEFFRFKRGVPIVVNELLKAEIERRLAFERKAKKRASKRRKELETLIVKD